MSKFVFNSKVRNHLLKELGEGQCTLDRISHTTPSSTYDGSLCNISYMARPAHDQFAPCACLYICF